MTAHTLNAMREPYSAHDADLDVRLGEFGRRLDA